MKHVFGFMLFLSIFSLSAQESEKDDIQRTIETFFEGFHQQDSMKIKQTVSDEIVMRRISIDSAGKTFVRQQDFSDFLNRIVSIPKTTQFREIIKSYSIRVDGPMAQAWTPYEFRVNGEFDHCGTNSFQLFKENRDWKIIYIIDTGRKEGCD